MCLAFNLSTSIHRTIVMNVASLNPFVFGFHVLRKPLWFSGAWQIRHSATLHARPHVRPSFFVFLIVLECFAKLSQAMFAVITVFLNRIFDVDAFVFVANKRLSKMSSLIAPPFLSCMSNPLLFVQPSHISFFYARQWHSLLFGICL